VNRSHSFVEYEPFAIDPQVLLETIGELDRDAAFARSTLDGIPHLAFTYEDDLLTPEAQQRTAERIFAELGLDPVVVRSTSVPMAPPGLRQRVTNADTVVDALAATEYAHLVVPPFGQPAPGC